MTQNGQTKDSSINWLDMELEISPWCSLALDGRVTCAYRKVMSKEGIIVAKVNISFFWPVFTGCVPSGGTNIPQGWVDSAWCCKSFAIVWKRSQNRSLWTKLQMNSGSPVSYVFGVWENKTAQDIAISSGNFLKINYFLFEIKSHYLFYYFSSSKWSQMWS